MIKKSTGIIFALNLLAYAFLAYQSSGFEISKEIVQTFGLYKKTGIFRESIFANWWQFFTQIFVHFNLEHLLVNMVFLILISHLADIDDKELLSAYLLSGFFASFIVFLFYPFESIIAGSSTPIFGLLGFTFYRAIRAAEKKADEKMQEKRLLYLIAVLLLFILSSEGSYFLHLIGFLTGVLVSKGFFESKQV